MASTKEFQRVNQIQLVQLQAAEHRAVTLQQSVDEIRQESVTDSLTSLANRRYFDASLITAVASAKAKAAPLALLFCDVDHFKKFNDQYGHRIGDQVLRLVASARMKNLRDGDIGARYGGEEIVAILPKTALNFAKQISERIRLAIGQTEMRRRGTGEKISGVTISIGVAALRPDDTAEQLIERAKACLYAAKNGGRNRTCCEDDLVGLAQPVMPMQPTPSIVASQATAPST